MILIEHAGEEFLFEMAKREKRLLVEVLKLYPLIPSSHHRITRSDERTPLASHQKLLDEAVAEHRTENKKQLKSMLGESGRFKPAKVGLQLSLSRAELEWLLQVLNDVRVGSWLLLGEPDEKNGKPIQLTSDNAQYVIALEASAYFQSILLSALDGISS